MKRHVDELAVEDSGLASESYKQSLCRISQQIDTGFYDQAEHAKSSECNHIFKAFDVYTDLAVCIEIFQRMVAPREDEELNQLLRARRQRLMDMEVEFADELDQLSDRLRTSGGSISDVASVSLECLALAQASIIASFNSLSEAIFGLVT